MGLISSIALYTELDAVNYMLRSIGESPLASLDNIGDLAEAQFALQALSDVNREVQSAGWIWNTYNNYVLRPTVNTYGSFIEVPDNTITIDPSDPSIDLIESVIKIKSNDNTVLYKKRAMYDRCNNTFQIKYPVAFDITFLVEFEDLPQIVRNAVTIRAARKFQRDVLGSDALEKISELDEQQAMSLLKKYECESGDYNIFDNYSSYTILSRNGSTI